MLRDADSSTRRAARSKAEWQCARECRYCANLYTPWHIAQVYCSARCREWHRVVIWSECVKQHKQLFPREKQPRPCVLCGQLIAAPNSNQIRCFPCVARVSREHTAVRVARIRAPQRAARAALVLACLDCGATLRPHPCGRLPVRCEPCKTTREKEMSRLGDGPRTRDLPLPPDLAAARREQRAAARRVLEAREKLIAEATAKLAAAVEAHRELAATITCRSCHRDVLVWPVGIRYCPSCRPGDNVLRPLPKRRRCRWCEEYFQPLRRGMAFCCAVCAYAGHKATERRKQKQKSKQKKKQGENRR